MDVQVAKVVVRRLVRNGWRKGPTDLLLISDHEYDQWLEHEARSWLKEQVVLRRGAPLEIR
jgi:hypothetical protein